jgi:hypothetical protein
MVGRTYKLYNGTMMRIAGIVGEYYRVKNLGAGHTTSYEKKDFDRWIEDGSCIRIIDKQETLQWIKESLNSK